MKINEIIARVQSMYSKGVSSDNVRLSERHIYSKLVTARSQVLRRMSEQYKTITEWNYTTFNCIQMKKVEAHECPCLPERGCKVWRSTFVIPKAITLKFSDSISWVMGVLNEGAGTLYLTPETVDSMRYVGNSKYTSNKPRYVIANGYLFVYGLSMSEEIENIYLRMRMIVEDPIESVQQLFSCDQVGTAVCQDFNEIEFPLDASRVEEVVQLALTELVELFSSMDQDRLNNSAEEKGVRPAPQRRGQRDDEQV